MYGQGIPKSKPVATPANDDDREVSLDEWDDIVADHYRVPKNLMKSMAGQESGGDIKAVSPTGVRGRYQVTEQVAKGYGLDRNNPFQQSVAAARYLREQYEALKDVQDDDERWLGAVGRYYGGPAAVRNGELSSESVDNLSNPADHVRKVAEKWGTLNRGQAGAPVPQSPAQAPPTTGIIEKPANRPVRPKPLTSNEQRNKQAAQIIKSIEASRNAAVQLFQQADSALGQHVSGVSNAQYLRARAEGALDQANRLAKYAQKDYADLIEAGFGEDTDPKSNRKWGYAKAKQVPITIYIDPETGRQTQNYDQNGRPIGTERQIMASNLGVQMFMTPTAEERVGQMATNRQMARRPVSVDELPQSRDPRLMSPEGRRTASDQFLRSLAIDKVRAEEALRRAVEEEAQEAPESMIGRMGSRIGRATVRGIKGALQAPYRASRSPLSAQAINQIGQEYEEIGRKYFPIDERTPALVNPFKPEFWTGENIGRVFTQTLPDALGSMIPYILLGRGVGLGARLAGGTAALELGQGGALTLAEVAAPKALQRLGVKTMGDLASSAGSSGLGALQGVSQGYEAAKAAGLSEDAARKSGAIEGIIGMLEGLGSPATRGTFMKTALREIPTGAREEFIQEGWIQLLQGVNAAYLTGYDKNKGIRDIVGEALGAGAVGGILGGLGATPGAIAGLRSGNAGAAASPVNPTFPQTPLSPQGTAPGKPSLATGADILAELASKFAPAEAAAAKPTLDEEISRLETEGESLSAYAMQNAAADPETASQSLNQALGRYGKAIKTLEASPEYQNELIAIARGEQLEATPYRDRVTQLKNAQAQLENFVTQQKQAEVEQQRAEKLAQAEAERQAKEAEAQAKRAEIEQQRALKAQERAEQQAAENERRQQLADEAMRVADESAARIDQLIEQGDVPNAIGELRARQQTLRSALKYLPETAEGIRRRAEITRQIEAINPRISDLKRRSAERARPQPASQATPLLESIVNPEGGNPQLESIYEPGARFLRLAEEAPDLQEETPNLLTAIRRAGGIRSDGDTTGELRRLGLKEGGTTGLLNNKSGSAIDRMREMMVSEGLSRAETVSEFYDEIEQEMRAAQNRKGREEEDMGAYYERLAEEERNAPAAGRVVRIGDEEVELTPEQAARWAAEVDEPLRESEERYRRDMASTNPRIREEAGRRRKADAMRIAAKKREIADRLTGKELAARGAAQSAESPPAEAPAPAAQPAGSFMSEFMDDLDPAEAAALRDALDRYSSDNPRDYADRTRPGEPGSGGVSFSPYSVLVANNREQVNQLYKLDLRSDEAIGIIDGLREYAVRNDIELRHLHNLLNAVRNDQLERARFEDRGLSYDEIQIADRQDSLDFLEEQESGVNEEIKRESWRLADEEVEFIQRTGRDIDDLLLTLHEDADMMEFFEAAVSSEKDFPAFEEGAVNGYGFSAETARYVVEQERAARRPRSPDRGRGAPSPVQTETSRTDQKRGDPRSNRQSQSQIGPDARLTAEDYDLLSRNLTTIPDAELDDHLRAVENLRNLGIRGPFFGGKLLEPAEERQIRAVLDNVNDERTLRRGADAVIKRLGTVEAIQAEYAKLEAERKQIARKKREADAPEIEKLDYRLQVHRTALARLGTDQVGTLGPKNTPGRIPTAAEREARRRLDEETRGLPEEERRRLKAELRARQNEESGGASGTRLNKQQLADAMRDQAAKKEEGPTLTHPDPALDQQPILAERADGRVVIANPENKSGISIVKDRSNEETEHKFSSTQVNLPQELANRVREFAKRIPDADLAENGREDESHVTIKYGLHGSRAGSVREILEGAGRIKAKLGRISLFTDNPDFDVIKIEVESEDLRRLNEALAEGVPNTEKFPEYNPHVTIAYVKKGRGDRYVGNRSFLGQNVEFDQVKFSGREGNQENIRVAESAKEAPKQAWAPIPADAKLTLMKTPIRDPRSGFTGVYSGVSRETRNTLLMLTPEGDQVEVSRDRVQWQVDKETASDKPKFVADAEQRLRDAAQGKLAGAGFNQMADIAIVTGYRIYRKGMTYAQWAKAMVRELGEDVRPHLKKAWDSGFKNFASALERTRAEEDAAYQHYSDLVEESESIDQTIASYQAKIDELKRRRATVGTRADNAYDDSALYRMQAETAAKFRIGRKFYEPGISFENWRKATEKAADVADIARGTFTRDLYDQIAKEDSPEPVNTSKPRRPDRLQAVNEGLSASQKKLADLEAEDQALTDQIKDLEERLSGIDDERDALQSRFEASQEMTLSPSERRSLEAEAEKLQADLAAAERDSEAAEQALESFEGEDDVSPEYARLYGEYERAEQAQATIQEKIDQIEEQLSETEDEIDKFLSKEEYKAARAELATQLKSVKAELRRLERQSGRLSQSIEDATADVDAFKTIQEGEAWRAATPEGRRRMLMDRLTGKDDSEIPYRQAENGDWYLAYWDKKPAYTAADIEAAIQDPLHWSQSFDPEELGSAVIAWAKKSGFDLAAAEPANIQNDPASWSYFGTPRVEKLPETKEEAHELIGNIRSEFRPKSDSAGTVWVNHQATMAISSAAQELKIEFGGTAGWSGISMSLRSARRIMDFLSQAAEDYGDVGARLSELTENMRQGLFDAYANAKAGIVFAEPAGSKNELKATLREERFHQWQQSNDLLNPLITGALHVALRGDPVYDHIVEQLILNEGYLDRPTVLAVEVPAKIASGQWAAYNLESAAQGDNLLHRYFRAAAQLLGPEVLLADAPGTARARGVQQDVREILGIEKETTARRGATRQGIQTRNSDGNQSGDPNRLEGRIRGGRGSGSETAGGRPVSGNRSRSRRPGDRGQATGDRPGAEPTRGRARETAPGGGGLGGRVSGGRGRGGQATDGRQNARTQSGDGRTAADGQRKNIADAARRALGGFSIGPLEGESSGGTILGAGLGSLQAWTAQPTKPRAQVGLPVGWNLSKWARNLHDQLQEGVANGKISNKRATKILEAIREVSAADAAGDGIALFLARENLAQLTGEKFSWADVAGAPRSIKAGLDLSFAFRQGGAYNFPGLFLRPIETFRRIGKGFASMREGNYGEVNAQIAARPRFQQMMESGLHLSNQKKLEGNKLTDREEGYLARFMQNVPGYKQSERGNTTLLDLLRADTFDRYATYLEKRGLTFEKNPDAYKQMAKFVNLMTGRGTFGEYDNAIPFLSLAMFSPRWVASRVQLLKLMVNPLEYRNVDPALRRLMWRDLGQYAGALGLTLGMLAAAGAYGLAKIDVGDEPDDPDFGKVIINGKYHYDLTSGLQQYLVFGTRMANAFYKRDYKGERLRDSQQPSAIALKFLRSKASPAGSLVANVMTGKDYTGQLVSASSAAADLVYPLLIKDFVEGYNLEGVAGGLASLPATIGVGYGVYEKGGQAARVPKLRAEAEKADVFFGDKRIEGEPPELQQARLTRRRQYVEQYGAALVNSGTYRSASAEDKAALLKKFNDVSNALANEKTPDLGKLDPDNLMASLEKGRRQSEQSKRRQGERLIFGGQTAPQNLQ